MRRRTVLWRGAVVISAVVIFVVASMSWFPARGAGVKPDKAPPPERPPNIILILTDDQGYGDLGCYGSRTLRTPRIDRMAAEGMAFTHFYAQTVCGPSRASLMTGCYPIRVGEPGNTKGEHTILHPQEITLAEVLKQAGYSTAAIGKWHLGEGASGPTRQGFDSFFGTPLFHGKTVRVEDDPFRCHLVRGEEVVDKAVEIDTLTRLYTEEAVRYVRANAEAERPFFLYLAHNMPHIPLAAPAPFKGRAADGPYGDAIEEIDWSTGQVLDAVKASGIDRETLVIFMSDNGPWIEPTHPDGSPFIPADHSGSAGPLRGAKITTWEGGLRVPCIVRWPGQVPAGAVCPELTASIDLLPTLAALAGARLPEGRTIDGKDIGPLMRGEPGAASPHEAFYYYAYTHLQAVRVGRWKLVLPRPAHPPWTGWSARLIEAIPAPQLYDLHADPSESRDLAGNHPDEVARLTAAAERAREELGDYDRVGAGARFFDPGPRRPRAARWQRNDSPPADNSK